MSKLLSANFMRLKKDKFFWIGIIFMFAAGVLYPTMIYRDVQKTGIINTVMMPFVAVPCLSVSLWQYFAAYLSVQNIVMEQFGTRYYWAYTNCSLLIKRYCFRNCKYFYVCSIFHSLSLHRDSFAGLF